MNENDMISVVLQNPQSSDLIRECILQLFSSLRLYVPMLVLLDKSGCCSWTPGANIKSQYVKGTNEIQWIFSVPLRFEVGYSFHSGGYSCIIKLLSMYHEKHHKTITL